MENRKRTEPVKLGEILNCEKCGGLNLAIELAQLYNLLDPKGELKLIDPLNPINTLQNIELGVKNLLFSVEASERENEYLRKLLKNRPPLLESPDE
jgi:hypothetical protein